MSLTYGYYNSVSGDRLYTAAQMSDYFKGIIANGVLQSVGDAMVVTAAGDMDVEIGIGRAVINGRWAEILDETEKITLNGADNTYPRYTAIVLTNDLTNRQMTLTAIDGTPSATPSYPSISDEQLCLAMVRVNAGVTFISQANIIDTRPDSALCGWTASLVQNLDTSTLFLQWQEAYNNYLSYMETSWGAWFDEGIVKDLNVSLYIEKHELNYYNFYTDSVYHTEIVPLVMGDDYVYKPGDVITVFKNGFHAIEGETEDYTIISTGDGYALSIPYCMKSVMIDVIVLESKVGIPTGGGTDISQYKIDNIDGVATTDTAEGEVTE